MASTVDNVDFPIWALLPRKETGVVNLLSKNPQYDGRGTIIAIFDSGVDPTAPGMQVTTDGKPKVIDRIDPSGAGDVDTSYVAEAIDGNLNGLTGRTLKVPDSWVNPSGKYHLGCKSAYSLYPSNLRDRIVRERKEKSWDPVHKELTADAQRNFQCVKTALENKSNGTLASPLEPTTQASTDGNGSPDAPKPSLSESSISSTSATFLEKIQRDSAEAKVNLLNSLEKKYNDVGPVFDCVVFHDGEVWRACIDTSECGNLSEGILLGEFRKTYDAAKLTATDQFTVTINVYNEGNRLEIVGMCSSHGTHVASISAANFPDSPEKNGVAPGAQIVSISIGDNRLSCMETGTATVRAMARVMDNPDYKVDIINMSYGEHGHWSNSGRFGDIAHEVVNKYGVIWVVSASNHGPALSTVGIPPDIYSDFIISVGAYVSPDMMTAEYSMMEKLPGCPYTWSSRGPTMDGGRGVTICAPGGAITSVPTFTLRKNQLMNGTSMSSPHTAGCVSLLVSALKQKGILYSPYSIRRAIENSAQRLDVDVFAQGHGLLQVDRALDHLSQFSNEMTRKIRFSVECGKHHEKGIYFRNWAADKPCDCAISVEPILLNEQAAAPEEKLCFNLELVLTCDAPWVKAPPCLQISYTMRSFKICVDPRGLPRGQIYFTSIKAYSVSEPEAGFLFEVPVTMVVPEVSLINNTRYLCPSEHYRSGRIRRHFITAPLEATWAVITLKSIGSEKTQRFTLHAVQLKPLCNVQTLECHKIFNIGPEETSTFIFHVQGGLDLEVCLARWWSCLVDGCIELTVDFHSIYPSREEVSFVHSDSVTRLDLKLGFQPEDVLPQAVLKSHCQTLTPSDSKVEVLGGPRDTIPTGRPIYQLVLSYNFSILKSGVEVTPKCPMLNDVLYESPYESQLWMLFDINKQHLSSGDAYSSKYSLKLDKGDYTLRMHVRHEHCDLLEKLTELPFTIITKLPQEVKLDVYSSYNAAITSGRKIQSHLISKGVVQPYYIASPNLADKTLKSLGLSAGHVLLGTITYSKDEAVKKAVQYPLSVFISEFSTNIKKRGGTSSMLGGSSEDKKEPKSLSDYQEAMRDVQTSWIPKLDEESSNKVYQDVLSSHPDHLPAHLARLQALDSLGGMENREEVIELAKQIIASIDVSQFLTFYGTKTDTRPDAAKIKVQMDKQKNIYLEALAKLGNSLCANLADLPSDERETKIQELDNIASDILKFVDPSDSKVINFFITYYQLRELDGLAARLITKQTEEKWTKENENKLLQIYRKLGWDHAASNLERAHPIRFPTAFQPF